MALQGTETSFYLLTLALVLWIFSTRIDPPLLGKSGALPSPRDLVLLGACLGLAFWGRTEAVLLAFLTLVCLLGVLSRGTRAQQKPILLLRALFVVGGTFLLSVLPWLVFSYHAVGTLAQ